jgi:hemoglobin
MNRKLFLKLSLVAPVLLLATAAVQAEPAAYPGVPADAYRSAESFGGVSAMQVWAQDLNYYVLGDNRINQIFKFNGDPAKQQALQNDVLALVLNSPLDKATAEATFAKYGLNLTRTEYNAVIEDAYLACDATRTPYGICNRIITAMAPLEHVAVTR